MNRNKTAARKPKAGKAAGKNTAAKPAAMKAAVGGIKPQVGPIDPRLEQP